MNYQIVYSLISMVQKYRYYPDISIEISMFLDYDISDIIDILELDRNSMWY